MSRPIQRVPVYLFFLSLVALAWLPAGCDLNPPGAPEQEDAEGTSISDFGGRRGQGNSDFFPLDFGNRWQHTREITIVMIPDGGEPQDPMTFRSGLETEVTGNEIVFGTSYVVTERRWNGEGNEGVNWIRYRQDRSGLYEADVALNDPPDSGLGVLSASRGLPTGRLAEARRERLALQLRARGAHPRVLRAVEAVLARHAMIRAVALAIGNDADADQPTKAGRPGGPLALELTRLSYPLHPGASWDVRSSPHVTATVEGAETLDLPAGRFQAWRIRIDWPGNFGPRDVVHVWFGRCGELQFAAHLEGEQSGPDGIPAGYFISDESEVLVDLDLVRGRCN